MIMKDKTAIDDAVILTMIENLSSIYSNRSSDEYKSHGNITLSQKYSDIEKMISNLTLIKKFPKEEASDLKILFSTLHRPVFNKMVTEYIAEPNDKNVIFTAVYTVGYRVLIGELSRIYASTEATSTGIVYKPDKISRRADMNSFIKVYNANLEQRLDRYIRSTNNDDLTKPVQESAAIDAVSGAAVTVLNIVPKVFITIGNIFRGAKELNPIALISAILSRSYDNKVKKFDETVSMYNATKKAYDEYVKIPEAQRKKKIESRYIKDLDKYNIKMKNLKAQIDHYDSRSFEEMKDSSKNKLAKRTATKPATSDTSPETSDPATPTPSTSNNDDMDF